MPVTDITTFFPTEELINHINFDFDLIITLILMIFFPVSPSFLITVESRAFLAQIEAEITQPLFDRRIA